MRNNLPPGGPRVNESAIVNLDDESGPGTHWVAYRKTGQDVLYFDSFGNLQPPKELVKYLKVDRTNNVYQTTGGLHGVGISVVNALSDYLEVKVYKQGKLFKQSYAKGQKLNDLTSEDIAKKLKGILFQRFKIKFKS